MLAILDQVFHKLFSFWTEGSQREGAGSSPDAECDAPLFLCLVCSRSVDWWATHLFCLALLGMYIKVPERQGVFLDE